jgi:hypothetical protein
MEEMPIMQEHLSATENTEQFKNFHRGSQYSGEISSSPRGLCRQPQAELKNLAAGIKSSDSLN